MNIFDPVLGAWGPKVILELVPTRFNSPREARLHFHIATLIFFPSVLTFSGTKKAASPSNHMHQSLD